MITMKKMELGYGLTNYDYCYDITLYNLMIGEVTVERSDWTIDPEYLDRSSVWKTNTNTYYGYNPFSTKYPDSYGYGYGYNNPFMIDYDPEIY